MDAHRPARADLGLPSPGVAGDADAGDAGVPDASLSLHPHPILGNHAGRGDGLSPASLAGPLRPPSERVALAGGGGGISPALPSGARPPIPEAASAGDSVSDAADRE